MVVVVESVAPCADRVCGMTWSRFGERRGYRVTELYIEVGVWWTDAVDCSNRRQLGS